MKNFFKHFGQGLAIPFTILDILIELTLLFTIKLMKAILTGTLNNYRRMLTFYLFVIKDGIKQIKENDHLTFLNTFAFRTHTGNIAIYKIGILDNEPIFEIK